MNIYAIVLDASAPYYLSSISKHMCTMKLIDDTVNSTKSFGNKPPFLSVTFFSRNKMEIPPISQIGTVIRIHRGDTKSFKKSYQLNCDTGIKGSWAIFDPFQGNASISHTGKTYTFVDDDKKRLKDIREFGVRYFRQEDATEFSSMGMNLEEVDMIALVLKRKEKKNDNIYDQLTVFDGKKFCKINVPKTRYTSIGVQDVVRIRGLTEDVNELVVNDYTNIMKIDKDYEAAVNFLKQVEESKENKKIQEKLRIYIPVIDKSCVVSEVLDKSIEVTTLKKLYKNSSAILANNRYRIKVNVLEIGPKDNNNWVVPVNEETRKNYNLPESKSFYYKLQMFTKDFIDENDHDIYPIYLCNIEGKGDEFIPSHVKGNYKELKKIYKVLIKPWFHLDLIVEPVVTGTNVLLFIVDTKLII